MYDTMTAGCPAGRDRGRTMPFNLATTARDSACPICATRRAPAGAIIGALLAIVMPGTAPTAQTQQPATPPAAAQPDAAFLTARTAFEALPEAERKAIQSDLVWTGDYNGTLDGGFGRRSFDGLRAFETRVKGKPDGVLDAAERKTLAELAGRARTSVKFTVQDDPKAGFRIGLPTAILTARSDLPNGSQWRGALGKATLSSATLAGDADALAKLYEARISDTAGGRKVTYKVLRPDWFVVTGEIGPRRFYTRYALGEGKLRGFTLAYDAAAAPQWEPLVIAIANAFEPFPAAGGSPGGEAPGATPALPASPLVAGALAVATGKALMPRAVLEACKPPSLNGRPVRAGATSGDFVWIEAEGIAAAPLPPPSSETAAGLAVVALAHGTEGLSVAPGEITGGATLALTAALQPGAGGGLILDRAGRLVGIVAAQPAARLQIAGIVPSAAYRLVPAGAVTEALKAANIAPGSATSATGDQSAGALVARHGASVVRLTCAR